MPSSSRADEVSFARSAGRNRRASFSFQSQVTYYVLQLIRIHPFALIDLLVG